MSKFAMGLIKKLSLIAVTNGMIGAFVAYNALKEQRGANEDLIEVEIKNAGLAELVGNYVDTRGSFAEVRVDSDQFLKSLIQYGLQQRDAPMVLIQNFVYFVEFVGWEDRLCSAEK